MSTGPWLLVLVGWLAGYASLYRWWRGTAGRQPYHRDVLAVGGIALLVAGFFWRRLFVGDVWLPAGGGDFNSHDYPMYHFLAQHLRAGHLPLWNPYLYGGMPSFADIGAALYPVNLAFFLVFSPFTYQTLELIAIVHYFLAGAFAYALGRGLGISRFGSLVAGVVYAFSGFLVAHLGHLSQVETATWLPLVFLFFHQAIEKRSPGKAVLSGLFLGVALLAQHPQIGLYLFFALMLYWAYRAASARREELQRPLRLASIPALTAVVAVGIAALGWIPMLELLAHSVRASVGYQQSTEFSMGPVSVVTFFVSQFFGNSPTDHWGYWEAHKGSLGEFYGYIGILPLVLAGLGILLRPRPVAWFLFGLAVLSLLLSFGGYTILHGWAYRFLPGFDKVRVPSRFLLLLDFAAAMLAGFGADLFLRPLARRERPLFRWATRSMAWICAGVAFLLVPFFYYALLTSQDKDPVIFKRVAIAANSVSLALLLLVASLVILLAHRYLRRGRPVLLATLVAVIVFDLFTVGASYNPTTEDLTAGFQHPKIVGFLRQDTSFYRVDSATDAWDVWQPNASLLHRLYDVMGVYNTIMLADYNEYWEALGSRSSPFYDFLNVRYVIGHKDVPLDWTKFQPVFTDAPSLNVYENTQGMPRALVVNSALVEPDSQKALEAVKAAAFDPRQTVLLEKGRPLSLPAGNASARILRYSPDEIVVETTSETEGYLVLSEVYYPGWTATVDGSPEDVLRANYAFRAVPLPAGTHQVKMVFAPRSWELGKWITLATLAALAGFFVAQRLLGRTGKAL